MCSPHETSVDPFWKLFHFIIVSIWIRRCFSLVIKKVKPNYYQTERNEKLKIKCYLCKMEVSKILPSNQLLWNALYGMLSHKIPMIHGSWKWYNYTESRDAKKKKLETKLVCETSNSMTREEPWTKRPKFSTSKKFDCSEEQKNCKYFEALSWDH